MCQQPQALVVDVGACGTPCEMLISVVICMTSCLRFSNHDGFLLCIVASVTAAKKPGCCYRQHCCLGLSFLTNPGGLMPQQCASCHFSKVVKPLIAGLCLALCKARIQSTVQTAIICLALSHEQHPTRHTCIASSASASSLFFAIRPDSCCSSASWRSTLLPCSSAPPALSRSLLS